MILLVESALQAHGLVGWKEGGVIRCHLALDKALDTRELLAALCVAHNAKQERQQSTPSIVVVVVIITIRRLHAHHHHQHLDHHHRHRKCHWWEGWPRTLLLPQVHEEVEIREWVVLLAAVVGEPAGNSTLDRAAVEAADCTEVVNLVVHVLRPLPELSEGVNDDAKDHVEQHDGDRDEVAAESQPSATRLFTDRGSRE